jgi:hypothetical protein
MWYSQGIGIRGTDASQSFRKRRPVLGDFSASIPRDSFLDLSNKRGDLTRKKWWFNHEKWWFYIIFHDIWYAFHDINNGDLIYIYIIWIWYFLGNLLIGKWRFGRMIWMIWGCLHGDPHFRKSPFKGLSENRVPQSCHCLSVDFPGLRKSHPHTHFTNKNWEDYEFMMGCDFECDEHKSMTEPVWTCFFLWLFWSPVAV